MEEHHATLLRKYRPFIVKQLIDIEAVCDQLIAFEIFTENMVDDIMSKSPSASKTRHLLSLLVMRGPNAFNSFYEALIITKNNLIAFVLKPPNSGGETKPKADSPDETILLKVPSFDISQREMNDNQDFRSLGIQQGNLDDSKTEYSEYDNEMLQRNQTKSKSAFSFTAQVSEENSLSSGILVSGSDLHVAHGNPEVSSEEQRCAENIHQNPYGAHNQEAACSLQGCLSVPSDNSLATELLNTTRGNTERGQEVTFSSSDEHVARSGGISSSQPVEQNYASNFAASAERTSNWPRTRSHSRPLADMNINKPALSQQQLQQFSMEIATDQVYPVDPKYQRRIIIINNSTFLANSGLPPRTTGNIDATSLDLLFKKLDFHTKTYNDCSCERMLDILNEEKNRDNLQQIGALVVVILSHGEGEKIYGTDGRTVNLRDIIKLFNEEHCPELTGKPKLFFILACSRQQRQSRRMDEESVSEGVDEAVSEGVDEESGSEEIDYSSLSVDILNSMVSKETEDGRTVPRDMFIARATTQCNAMFRGVSFGSRFIQALIHVVKEHSYKDDVMTLMEKMNQLVEPIERPLVEYTNILPKKFYFFHASSEQSLTFTL
ncbi:cell death protein 3-like [Ylistrum balloti]|uniref:cell death protein 3-like n=1 Tax=Ylistrum balloti TaxID=509963 RepID=UPI0029058142|nr:cell death protein 3-like [Ylistrum balloti]